MGLFSGLFNLGFDVLAAKTIYDIEEMMSDAYQKGFEEGKNGEPKSSFEMRQKLERMRRRTRNPSDRTQAIDEALQRLIDGYEEGYRDGQQTRRSRSYD